MVLPKPLIITTVDKCSCCLQNVDFWVKCSQRGKVFHSLKLSKLPIHGEAYQRHGASTLQVCHCISLRRYTVPLHLAAKYIPHAFSNSIDQPGYDLLPVIVMPLSPGSCHIVCGHVLHLVQPLM